MAIVLTFIFIVMFAIFWSSYIFSSYFGNIENEDIYNKANISLNNQFLYFKKILIYTNSNWWGYLTRPPEKKDLENDDDDFNWTTNDVDWVSDDDWDAFKYKFWVVVPDKEENVLFFDNKYFEYSNFTMSTLSWITVYSNVPWSYEIKIFDWSYYSFEQKFKLKKTLKWNLASSENFISLTDNEILWNDILAMFIKNTSSENLAYKIKWVGINNEDLPYFIPVVIKSRNFDLYVNTLIKWKNDDYFEFSKIYSDVLEWWKKPIAPSNLSWYWSWDTLYLNWDINDTTNTWSYYLFRWTDENVNCVERDFLTKIWSWYTENSFSWNYNIAGSFYYTLCSSNSNWWTWFTDIWKLSTPSSILNVIK